MRQIAQPPHRKLLPHISHLLVCFIFFAPLYTTAQKAKELAWSPGKNFMMTGFMLWMSGSGVHIFSIMITFYAVHNPVVSAVTVNKQFSRFEDAKMGSLEKASLLTSKATFVGMNLLAMSAALYKMSTMGLLPNTPSDWISFLAVPPNFQISTGS